MQPEAPRDFLKVALQRLNAAEAIMANLDFNLEVQYIGGYSVECSLKALLLEKTPLTERINMLYIISHGAAAHRAENLLGKLRDQRVYLTPELSGRMRRFDWDTSLRYETGRKDTGETKALLRTARMLYNWVEERIS